MSRWSLNAASVIDPLLGFDALENSNIDSTISSLTNAFASNTQLSADLNGFGNNDVLSFEADGNKILAGGNDPLAAAGKGSALQERGQ